MKKCGIYIIKNILNNKVYVGQSRNMKNRIYIHRYALRHNFHSNDHLQKAWNRDNEKSFIFEIIEECPFEILDEREIYYINFYDSYMHGYNGTTGGQIGQKVDPNRVKLNAKEVAEAHKIGALKGIHTRKSTKGKCQECGTETESGYFRFCSRHKGKCLQCGKRFDIKKGGIICLDCLTKNNGILCPGCNTLFIRKSNNQKYCSNCSQGIRNKNQKNLMKKRRLEEKMRFMING